MEGAPGGGEGSDAVCENCAREDDDLVQVWPGSGGGGAGGGGGDDAELWCADCRSQFPHEAVSEDDEAPAEG